MEKTAYTMTDSQHRALEIGPQRNIKISIATLLSIILATSLGVAAWVSTSAKLDALAGLPAEIRDLKERVIRLEASLGIVHTISAEANPIINLAADPRRAELKALALVTTTELAELERMSQRTIVGRIIDDLYDDGRGGKWAATRNGRRWLIENPYFVIP